jgi:hypothetical protein
VRDPFGYDLKCRRISSVTLLRIIPINAEKKWGLASTLGPLAAGDRSYLVSSAAYPCSEDACVSPGSYAASQDTSEAHVLLVAIGPWSWLRFVKLIEWYVSFTACGLVREVI